MWMIQPSTLVIIPRRQEMIANRMATPYRILLLVKCQILRRGLVQFKNTFVYVYLYTCLIARYICVARAARAVPKGVNTYGQGHAATLRIVRATLQSRYDYSHARGAGLPKFVTLECIQRVVGTRLTTPRTYNTMPYT